MYSSNRSLRRVFFKTFQLVCKTAWGVLNSVPEINVNSNRFQNKVLQIAARCVHLEQWGRFGKHRKYTQSNARVVSPPRGSLGINNPQNTKYHLCLCNFTTKNEKFQRHSSPLFLFFFFFGGGEFDLVTEGENGYHVCVYRKVSCLPKVPTASRTVLSFTEIITRIHGHSCNPCLFLKIIQFRAENIKTTILEQLSRIWMHMYHAF